MKSTGILLLVAFASVTSQQDLMPEWALRALDNGIVDPYVEFRYEISDECALINLRLVEAYPDNQWQKGDDSALLEIAARFIGPFDTAGTHDWSLLKESPEIARFEPAHYESRAIIVDSDDHAMRAECVFESGALLYVNAHTISKDGSQ